MGIGHLPFGVVEVAARSRSGDWGSAGAYVALHIGLIAWQRRFFTAAGRLLRLHGREVLHSRPSAVVMDMWRFYAPELIGSA